MNINYDNEPGSGEERERSEGRENRGGQAGAGKHQRDGEPGSNAGGGQQRQVKRREDGSSGNDRPDDDRPGNEQRSSRPSQK